MYLTEPEVKIIEDSVNYQGNRLTTFELKYWRPLLPEMNTHRVFSRNAASSRAQSFEDRCEFIRYNPALPEHWNAERLGMRGGEEFPEEIQDYINDEIFNLANTVIDTIQRLNESVKDKTGYGIHKQYLNRYLEPFTRVTQLVSSTEWDNFFSLRISDDAQPEMKDLALRMKEEMNKSIPVQRTLHLPYVTKEERKELPREECIEIAVARCARVCYKPYEGEQDKAKDLRLYSRLMAGRHWSPFEHIAFADPDGTFSREHRNFTGWAQLRGRYDWVTTD